MYMQILKKQKAKRKEKSNILLGPSILRKRHSILSHVFRLLTG